MVLYEEKPLEVDDVVEVRTIEPVSNVPAIVVMKFSGTVVEETRERSEKRQVNRGKLVCMFKRDLRIDNELEYIRSTNQVTEHKKLNQPR